MNNNVLKKRKPTRIKEYDYSLGGAYFITICTEQRKNVLCYIYDYGEVDLTEIGDIVKESLEYISNHYDVFDVDCYTIMPNHIHFILLKNTDEDSISLNDIIRRFKSYTSKKYGGNLWQRSYYDHIIRNTKDYEEISSYIFNNPKKWILDEYFEK